MKSKNSSAATVPPAWRFACVCGFLAVLLLALVVRLLQLQILAGEKGQPYLQRAGDALSLRTVANTALRGTISDRNGRPLAISTPVESLWIDPGKFEPQTVGILAQELKLDKGALEHRLERFKDKEFVYLKRHMPPDQARRILAMQLPGVNSVMEYKRFYPAGEVSAHLLGFTDTDQLGVDGMELTYDSSLRGESGSKKVLKNRKGETIKHIESVSDVKHGDDLRLSIDLRLQYYAARELKAAVEKFKARSGSVVILDAVSNEVLALVNEPTYNPNQRVNLSADITRNRALTDVVEPGSTMKPLTVLAALESGRYNANSLIDTAPGYIEVAGKTFADIGDYGQLDLAGVLKKSSQVGTSKIALDIGAPRIRELMQRFGVGQSLATGFPGESFGVLPDKASWHPWETITMAYGYGMAMTPLQIAQAYSILANEGVRKDVSLMLNEDEVYGERVIDAGLAQQVVEMLATTTEKGGTATRAAITGYSVAGKTGTLHRMGASGYEEENYVAVFAGFAPSTNPRFVAAVVIDDPRGGSYFGGEVAAPVFSRVIGESLRLMNVMPDNFRLASAE